MAVLFSQPCSPPTLKPPPPICIIGFQLTYRVHFPLLVGGVSRVKAIAVLRALISL